MKKKLLKLKKFLLEAYNKNEKPIGSYVWHKEAVNYCNKTVNEDVFTGLVFELNTMLIDQPNKGRQWILIYIDFLILEYKK